MAFDSPEPAPDTTVRMLALGSSFTPSTMVFGPTTNPWARNEATPAGSNLRGTTPLARSDRNSDAKSSVSPPNVPPRTIVQ
jgi:hypothetical protein